MTIVTILFMLSATLQKTEASELEFRHEIVDAEGPEDPWVKITGDIDGDGFVDIIIGGRKGPLVWYACPGWKKSVIADGGYNTVDGEAGDIDGDGDMDIIMGGLFWYENPRPMGDPAGERWKVHRVADHPTHDVEIGDIDGDGDLDIVTRDQSEFGHNAGNKIHVWIQKNSNSWTDRVIPCPHGEGISLSDIDGDRDLDIIIGGIWYENLDGASQAGWPEHAFASFHRNAAVKTADIIAPVIK